MLLSNMLNKIKVKIEQNKSITYMLPFLNEQLNLKFLNKMLNTYLFYSEEEDCFCVLYEWSSNPNFLKFELELMNHHLFLSHEDLGNKVLYKFRLSKNMILGRDLFIKGKYKEFSEDHKNSIFNFLKLKNALNINRIKDILNVNSNTVSSPPVIEKETFNKHVSLIKIKREDFKYESN